MERQINLELFKEPLPYKWRVQSFSKNKASATCVAYVDARAVMDRLDEVVGPENWTCRYEQIKNNLYCYIGIYINGRLIEKSDCGTESNVDKEKGESSDAFKRAAVKWAIGRFLYDLPMQYLPASEKKASNNYPFVVDDSGKQVWDLTSHINNKLNKNNKLQTKKETSKQDSEEEIENQRVLGLIKTINACMDIDVLRKINTDNEGLGKKRADNKALLSRIDILTPPKPKTDQELMEESVKQAKV